MSCSTSPNSWRRSWKEIKYTKTYGIFYQSKLMEETLEGNQKHQNIWHNLPVQAYGGNVGRKSKITKHMAYSISPDSLRRHWKEPKYTKTYGIFYQSKCMEETSEGKQVYQSIWHILSVQAHGGDVGRKSNIPKHMAHSISSNLWRRCWKEIKYITTYGIF